MVIIKEREVIREYQRALFCEECDVEMELTNDVVMTNPPTYKYKCPNCGQKYETHHINFVNQELGPWKEVINETM